MERHHGLEQARRARASLEVADVALGRAKRDSAAFGIAKYLAQAFDLGHVADAGAGAVCLDQRGRGRVEPGVVPGALHGQHLTDWVGRGDALALAVA